MAYLIDTNVLSELRKGERCDVRVAAWAAGARKSDLFLSALVVGEVRRGIEMLRRRDPTQVDALDAWLARVVAQFGERILPVTRAIAETWGRLSVPNRLPVVDGLLAATAQVHGLTLVTRNVRDVAPTGIAVVNPFEAPSGT